MTLRNFLTEEESKDCPPESDGSRKGTLETEHKHRLTSNLLAGTLGTAELYACYVSHPHKQTLDGVLGYFYCPREELCLFSCTLTQAQAWQPARFSRCSVAGNVRRLSSAPLHHSQYCHFRYGKEGFAKWTTSPYPRAKTTQTRRPTHSSKARSCGLARTQARLVGS